MPIQIRNDEMVALLRPDFQARYEPNFAWKSAASVLRTLPGLRAAWTMGSFDENGDQFDVSGQGRTLSYNGNPTYGYRDLAPYLDLDGTGDYLSRADEAGLDILGTETYVAAAVRGLTCGIWFSPDRLTHAEVLIDKWGALAADQAYKLEFRGDVANDPVRFLVGDGAATDVVVMDSIVDTTTDWYFAAGRYDPSTEIKVWAGHAGGLYSNTNVVGIPAALANSGTRLTVGNGSAGTTGLDGRISMAWLCCAYLTDAQVAAIWEQTRAMFGG